MAHRRLDEHDRVAVDDGANLGAPADQRGHEPRDVTALRVDRPDAIIPLGTCRARPATPCARLHDAPLPPPGRTEVPIAITPAAARQPQPGIEKIHGDKSHSTPKPLTRSESAPVSSETRCVVNPPRRGRRCDGSRRLRVLRALCRPQASRPPVVEPAGVVQGGDLFGPLDMASLQDMNAQKAPMMIPATISMTSPRT